MVHTMQLRRFYRGEELSPEQEAAVDRNPDLAILEGVEERLISIDSRVDNGPRAVTISLNCVKADGSAVTLDDFPDGWTFGNGVTVGASVNIKGHGIMVLSWVVFPDTCPSVDIIGLTQIMELDHTPHHGGRIEAL